MGLGSLLAVGLVCSMVMAGCSAKNPEQVPVLRAPGQPAEGLPVIHDALLILSQGFEAFAQAENDNLSALPDSGSRLGTTCSSTHGPMLD